MAIEAVKETLEMTYGKKKQKEFELIEERDKGKIDNATLTTKLGELVKPLDLVGISSRSHNKQIT